MPKFTISPKLKKALPYVGVGALVLVALYVLARRKAAASEGVSGTNSTVGTPIYPFAFGGGGGGGFGTTPTGQEVGPAIVGTVQQPSIVARIGPGGGPVQEGNDFLLGVSDEGTYVYNPVYAEPGVENEDLSIVTPADLAALNYQANPPGVYTFPAPRDANVFSIHPYALHQTSGAEMAV